MAKDKCCKKYKKKGDCCKGCPLIKFEDIAKGKKKKKKDKKKDN